MSAKSYKGLVKTCQRSAYYRGKLRVVKRRCNARVLSGEQAD